MSLEVPFRAAQQTAFTALAFFEQPAPALTVKGRLTQKNLNVERRTVWHPARCSFFMFFL